MSYQTRATAARQELFSAQAAYEEARKQALQGGLMATKPLRVERILQLCVLGEAMMHADLRRQAALTAVAQAASGLGAQAYAPLRHT